ncbi:GNAT family N-acetyltransferase [filamentous cyanobacterium CCP1]|nr:GNAT family N-acetyltransferase [filamentous cyanobacterium CCP1]
MRDLVLQVVPFAAAKSAIYAIRYTVFHIEQGVALEIDFDGMDETSMHVVAYRGEEPVGTARIRMLNDRLAKIERVAVLAAYRGQGIGKALMEAAVSYLDCPAVPEIKLNSQVQAKSFYEKLGFKPQGNEFDEAGILHIEMRRSLQQT